jgi:opacity protein-like surface antigen
VASIRGSGFAALSKLVVVACLLGALAASAARSDWQIYVSGDVGISTSDLDSDGDYVSATPDVRMKGMDSDSSPLVGGAVGLEIPMDEILPREWLLDVRPPDWPVRFEIEGAGLREYELRTRAGGDKFYSEVEVATLFINGWLDIPMISIWRPFQYLFGLGRQPRVRSWLDPMSLYLGTGIGTGFLDFKGTSNALSLSDDTIDFAWNAGVGVDYALTERVSVGAGYRYVGVGKQSIDVDGPQGSGAGDELDYEQDIHEFRAMLRVSVYDFLSPWR